MIESVSSNFINNKIHVNIANIFIKGKSLKLFKLNLNLIQSIEIM